MALPTIVGVGAASSSINAITPALPAGVQQNDILILFLETSAAEAITVSGWTEAPASPAPVVGSATRLTVFWKRAGASETAPTTSDSGDHQIGAIMAVRGCVTTGNPFYICASTNTASSVTKTASAFRTFIDDVLVINAFSSPVDTLSQSYTGATNATLTNLTERLDAFTDAGNGGGLCVITGEKANAGSVAATTITDNSGANVGCQWTASLIPEMYTGVPVVKGRSAAQANLTAINMPVPSVAATNDLLVAFIETNNQTISITSPAGMTQAVGSPASNAGTNPTRLSVFYKWMAADTNVVTTDSGDHQIGQLIVIGNITTASGDPFIISSGSSGGTSSTISIPGGNTTRPNALILAAAATTYDPPSNAEDATFTSWTNADLNYIEPVLDYVNNVGTGGGLAVVSGYKTTVGAFGATTVTQPTSVEYATWLGAISNSPEAPILSADVSVLNLTGSNVDFPYLIADSSPVTLTGENANLAKGYALVAEAGTFAVTGQPVTFVDGYYILADSSPVVAGAETATLTKAARMAADAGEIKLSDADTQILAGTPEKFALNVVVDLIPERQKGNYQKYNQRLLVNGRNIPIRAWSYDESAGSIAGTLSVTLANVADKQYLIDSADIQFEIAEWINDKWRWLPLLNLGKLRQTNYTLLADVNSPNDTVQLSASNEAFDKLNAAPFRKIIWYDPERQDIDPDQVEGVIEADGTSTPALIVGVKNLTLHDLLRFVFVDGCGFGSMSTNLPNFAVSLATVEPGAPYPSAIGGLIGVFEPQIVATGTGAMHVSIRSGISDLVGGGRELTTDYTNTLSIGNDLVRLRGLALDVTVQRSEWQAADIERVTERQTIGDGTNEFSDVNTVIETEKYIRRYFAKSKPEIPVREETIYIKQRTIMNLDGNVSAMVPAGGSATVTTSESTERFYFDSFGRLYYRRKNVSALLPNPDGDFAFTGLIPVLEETERVRYALHPYRTNQAYRVSRELNQIGLIFTDTENQQLGTDYSRAAIDAWRSGNVVDTMSGYWGKISTIRENATPKRKDAVEVQTINVDYLAGTYVVDDREEKIGLVSIDTLVDEQRRIYIWGSDRNGIVEQVNLGEIPMQLAAQIGRNILSYRQQQTKTVQTGVIGLDPGLQRGMDVRLYGRNNEFLGNYRILGRRFDGNENGYTTTLTVKG